MNLSISNIAWSPEADQPVYEAMHELGYTGLEIAPTRIFPEAPYDHLTGASAFARELKEQYSLSVCSLQSIWYGRTERLFGSPQERKALLDYTKKAMDFAQAVGASNLVFGSPRNRQRPEGASLEPVLEFFRELEAYAACCGVVLSMEPNPPLYHTNFINTTPQACQLVQTVLENAGRSCPLQSLDKDSSRQKRCVLEAGKNPPGFGVNLDLGTMIENREDPAELAAWLPFIRHIHISEPGLSPLNPKNHVLRQKVAAFITKAWESGAYQGYVSIEMGRRASVAEVLDALQTVRSLFSQRNTGKTRKQQQNKN